MIAQKSHVVDKVDLFEQEMEGVNKEYSDKIDSLIQSISESKIGKRKQSELIHDLKTLKSHISSNNNFVMKQFKRSISKVVAEAKSTVSNYISSRLTSLGLEGLRKEVDVKIDKD